MEVVLSRYMWERDWAFLYSLNYLTDIHQAPPSPEDTVVDKTDLVSAPVELGV